MWRWPLAALQPHLCFVHYRRLKLEAIMGSTSIDVPNVWSAVFARCCSESCSDTATPGHRGILVLQVPVSLKRLWGVTKRNISMLYASNKNSIYIIIICRFSLFLHSGKIKISKQCRHLFPFFRSEVLLFRHLNNHSTFIKQKEKGKDFEMESVWQLSRREVLNVRLTVWAREPLRDGSEGSNQ